MSDFLIDDLVLGLIESGPGVEMTIRGKGKSWVKFHTEIIDTKLYLVESSLINGVKKTINHLASEILDKIKSKEPRP